MGADGGGRVGEGEETARAGGGGKGPGDEIAFRGEGLEEGAGFGEILGGPDGKRIEIDELKGSVGGEVDGPRVGRKHALDGVPNGLAEREAGGAVGSFVAAGVAAGGGALALDFRLPGGDEGVDAGDGPERDGAGGREERHVLRFAFGVAEERGGGGRALRTSARPRGVGAGAAMS